jgi:phage antirepressor YoqD-like protein
MNELIKVNVNEKQEPVVRARDLHEHLEVSTRYNDWFPRMIEYGFEEGQDFYSFLSKTSEIGGRPSIEHHITIDMAKELCMIQRNEKGRKARQYFIAVEKEFNSPEKVMARALMIADQTINNLKLENTEMKPKALFADAVSASKTSILVGELAKLLKQNNVDIGQNRLFSWLRENGYLIKRKGTDYNMPTQYSMKLGLFEVKETAFTHSDGHVTISKTPKVTGKGQIYFVNKLKGGAA